MNSPTAVLLVSLLLTPFSLGSEAKPEEEATARANAWLALLDQGKYEETWDAAARLFKGAVSKDDWKKQITAARSPLGKLVSRTVKSTKYLESLPGSPDGKYVVIQYDTTFEHKKAAVETVTPMMDPDGTWRVSGYYVR